MNVSVAMEHVMVLLLSVSAQLHGTAVYVVITVRMVHGASRAMTRVIVETTLRVTL